ncbi:MAG: hypothetical protein NTW04_06360 [Elusimicrobia bacterium]|nr:hypothetical protein [Elusimicrobiota bacterium]
MKKLYIFVAFLGMFLSIAYSEGMTFNCLVLTKGESEQNYRRLDTFPIAVNQSRKLQYEGNGLGELTLTQEGKICYVLMLKNKSEELFDVFCSDTDSMPLVLKGVNGKRRAPELSVYTGSYKIACGLFIHSTPPDPQSPESE